MTGSEYNLTFDPLFAPVDTANSSYDIKSTKIEIKLRKTTPGQKYTEAVGAAEADADEFDYDDEGDPVNGFFKKLYKDADPDTRRAMMKSYQESNGTALSTNWAEVGKGKVETSPPDGMEAKKWGE